MSLIEFSKEEKEVLVEKLKSYFDEELGQKIGQFECEFFLDFISGELGAFYYNKGLLDAQALLATKIDDITEALYELEKPTNLPGGR
ncbi:MAG: DUF2164 domain-containing protein [Pseudohongiellaceae bacterium]